MPNTPPIHCEENKEKSILFAYHILFAKVFSAGKIAETAYYYLFFTDGNFQEEKFEKFVETFVEENLFLGQEWIKKNFGSAENIDNILSSRNEFVFYPEFITYLQIHFSSRGQFPQQNTQNAKNQILSYIETKIKKTEISKIIDAIRDYVTNLVKQKK